MEEPRFLEQGQIVVRALPWIRQFVQPVNCVVSVAFGLVVAGQGVFGLEPIPLRLPAGQAVAEKLCIPQDRLVSIAHGPVGMRQRLARTHGSGIAVSGRGRFQELQRGIRIALRCGKLSDHFISTVSMTNTNVSIY